MLRVILLLCCSLFVGVVVTNDDAEGIRIPFFRQRTPRESAMNSKHLEKQLGIDLGWLYRPHHKNATNGTDAIALIRFLDSEFYAKVEIGQKGQTVNLAFDTAWQASWVISQDCEWTTVGCWFHNKYDHSSSSTYLPDGRKFRVSEETYNLTGYYSTDTFALGHSRVNNQSFVEIVSVPYFYLFSKTDGVMGMAYKTSAYEPFFYNLIRTGKIKKAIFSIYFNRDRSSNRGGNILLGYIDKKHIHQINKTTPEQITYLPVDGSGGYWKFDIDRIFLDLTSKNKTIPFCSHGCNGIIDSSSTNIIGPKDEVDLLHSYLQAKLLGFGRYRVNCNTANKLPAIDFILAGKNFTLNSRNYIQRMSLGSLTVCMSSFVPNDQTNWVMGGAFLSEFYSIYDMENNKIGFVKSASA